MKTSDLERLLDLIENGSMNRDRIFYDEKEDKRKFNRLCYDLRDYMDYYIENLRPELENNSNIETEGLKSIMENVWNSSDRIKNK